RSCTARSSSRSTSICETPAYRRCSPLAAGQEAISSVSKPFAADHSATSSRVSVGKAAVIRPSFMAAPPPRTFEDPSSDRYILHRIGAVDGGADRSRPRAQLRQHDAHLVDVGHVDALS